MFNCPFTCIGVPTTQMTSVIIRIIEIFLLGLYYYDFENKKNLLIAVDGIINYNNFQSTCVSPIYCIQRDGPKSK